MKYSQSRGLAMGTPLSAILAGAPISPSQPEVFLNHLEKNFIIHNSNKFYKNITYYRNSMSYEWN